MLATYSQFQGKGVCMSVCVYVTVYVCTCVNICMYMCVCVCCGCVCVYMCVLYMQMYECVCVYVSGYICVNVYLWTYLKAWASLIPQWVKNLPAMRDTWVGSLGWEDPLEKRKATHFSILAWRISWTV